MVFGRMFQAADSQLSAVTGHLCHPQAHRRSRRPSELHHVTVLHNNADSN